MSLSNEDLYWKAVSTRDRRALTAAYDRFAPGVLLNARKFCELADAKIVAAAVMEKFLMPQPPRRVRNVSNYLAVATRNASLTLLSSRSKRREKEGIYSAKLFSLGHVDFRSDSSLIAEADEVRYAPLLAGIQKLPLQQRECITLFYFGNYKYAKIAEITGLPLGIVRSAIQNGKIRLFHHLKFNDF